MRGLSYPEVMTSQLIFAPLLLGANTNTIIASMIFALINLTRIHPSTGEFIYVTLQHSS